MKNFLIKIWSIIKKNLTIIIILFIFLFLYICDNSSLGVGNYIMDNLKSIATSFTPTTDLFDDGSEVSFVSYFFGMKIEKQEEDVDFYLPTLNQNISNSTEFLNYSYNGILKSVAKGKVACVGYTKDNQKYVEIEHAKGYVSRYVGLTNIGVTTGENVGANKPIGMCSAQEKVKVYIYQNNNIVNLSEVKWKN